MITLAASLRVSCRYPLQLRNSTPVTKITFNPSHVLAVSKMPSHCQPVTATEDLAQLLVGASHTLTENLP